MTALEQGRKIGTTINHLFGGLKVEVEIRDVKLCYGQERYLVAVKGQKDSNEIWINA